MTLKEWMALSTFGLDASASKSDIQKQYVRLVKEHRPDRDPEGFQRIHDAYQILMELHNPDETAGEQEPAGSAADARQNGREQEKSTEWIGWGSEGQREDRNKIGKESGNQREDRNRTGQDKTAAVQDFDFGEDLEKDLSSEENTDSGAALAALSKFIKSTGADSNAVRFQDFLSRPEISSHAQQKDFISSMAELLQQYSQSPDVYTFLLRYYHLEDVQIPEALPYEKARLFRVLKTKKREAGIREAVRRLQTFLGDSSVHIHFKRFKAFFSDPDIREYAGEEAFAKTLHAWLERDSDDVDLKRPISAWLLHYYQSLENSAGNHQSGVSPTVADICTILKNQTHFYTAEDILILILLAAMLIPVPAAMLVPRVRLQMVGVKAVLSILLWLFYLKLHEERKGVSSFSIAVLISAPAAAVLDVLFFHIQNARLSSAFVVLDLALPCSYLYWYAAVWLLRRRSHAEEKKQKNADGVDGRKSGGTGRTGVLAALFVQFYCFPFMMILLEIFGSDAAGFISSLIAILALIWFAALFAVPVILIANWAGRKAGS